MVRESRVAWEQTEGLREVDRREREGNGREIKDEKENSRRKEPDR